MNITMSARCAVLAACNPQTGRFDDSTPEIEQLGLEPPLVSRFDLVFCLKDRPNKKNDEDIATHILKTVEGNDESAFYSPSIMRGYIAHAKTINPVMSKEASARIKKEYLRIRALSEDNRISITTRQLHAFIRLAEASARMRLSPTVEIEDADRAVKINIEAYRLIAADSGSLNADTATGAMPTHKRGKASEILNHLKITGGDKLPGIMLACGIDEVEANEIISKLRKNGDVLENRGIFKSISSC
jgi:replicative DNA helicase Mcm